jgi:hypothetical protein
MRSKTAATKKQATKGGEKRKGKVVAKAASTSAKRASTSKRTAPAGRTARKKTAPAPGAPWGYTNDGVPRRKPGVKPKRKRRS